MIASNRPSAIVTVLNRLHSEVKGCPTSRVEEENSRTCSSYLQVYDYILGEEWNRIVDANKSSRDLDLP
jgi:hypothetical protein